MPGFRLTADEAWELLDRTHTGVVTTLRKDGRPIALPVWFATLDGAVYLRTPTGTKKLTRIGNDPRAHFLAEHGEKWAELTAVTFEAHATVVEDEALEQRAKELIDAKYAGFEAPLDKLPDAVKQTYGEYAVVKLEPQGRLNSWNNAALVQP